MKIGECSLKQWLPINHIAELVAIKFEAVYPGNGQLDPRYRKHHAIKKFLDDTSLEQSVHGKQLRFDFLGSSAEPERPNYERAVTWFLQARVRLRGDRNFSDVLADGLPRQEASLKAASLISYACKDVSGEGSEHPGTMQVQILLHGKSGTGIRRGTVEAWLPLGDEIEDLVIEPIHPGKSKQPYTSHPTVQTFYATTALQGDPAAGTDKRLRVIHHGTEEVKKAGRPKGSNKAAQGIHWIHLYTYGIQHSI